MSETRIEVLYLAPWVDIGGADKGTIDWFAGLDRDRFRLSLMTTQPSSNRWLHRIEPHADDLWELPREMPRTEMPAFILDHVDRRRVDVVHVMNSRLGMDLLPDLAALDHPPVTVVQLHAEEPGHGGYVAYASSRYEPYVDRFSVTSDHLAARMSNRHGIAREQIAVIWSGVDAHKEFDPARVERAPAVGGSRPSIVWIGRLEDQKDPMLMLEVARRLVSRDVCFELHVVGDGSMRDAVHQRAGELGLGDVVRFHGPTEQIAPWLAAADVMLMTSRFEGVPFAIYESLAMAVPVVAPALPGNAEVMGDAGGILVAEHGDPDAYARALEALLGAPAARAEIGARARARMLASFGVDRMCREHEALYERLLSSGHSAHPLHRRWYRRWLPPDTQPLVKRMAPDGRIVVTLGPEARSGSPFHLGAALTVARANTLRLVERSGRYAALDVTAVLPRGARALGFISSALLPEMEPLERRRLRLRGRNVEVLCAGPEDPQRAASEHVETLGWIDPYATTTVSPARSM